MRRQPEEYDRIIYDERRQRAGTVVAVGTVVAKVAMDGYPDEPTRFDYIRLADLEPHPVADHAWYKVAS